MITLELIEKQIKELTDELNAVDINKKTIRAQILGKRDAWVELKENPEGAFTLAFVNSLISRDRGYLNVVLDEQDKIILNATLKEFEAIINKYNLR